MLCCLLAYDAAGTVIATLDTVVVHDENGDVVGLVDFAAHEAAGGEHTAVWAVAGAAGSKVWPEWLGLGAHQFRVELTGPPGGKRIAALIHKTSGHRRERSALEGALAAIEPDANGARDIRHLVGGPDRPLVLNADGRTVPRQAEAGAPTHLPLIQVTRG
jgi:hypothetical protein